MVEDQFVAGSGLPGFSIQAKDVKILKSPSEFYDTLLVGNSFLSNLALCAYFI